MLSPAKQVTSPHGTLHWLCIWVEDDVSWTESHVHMMYDRNLLERLHLITLAPPSWHKTTVCTGAYSRSAVVEWVVCKLALKQSQHSWLGNAEVLELDGGPFEEEIHEEIQQQRRRVWSEINLGKVLGLLINDTTFHKHGISPGYLISHNRLTNQLFPYRTT